ncbi:hypothetical protein [Vitiosangium sp. GDMCC 1.1324]|uniref:hypothetical protein n=1 Tax=Vitiosangium sp. (strain GDMCC 1.1324) TaxID=2138576 RepID=UPI000D3597F2|nr:hypothetical protein [Vitiosangium sp. GDMCC 1.1324]PTL78805.1 hypothetical protein DAT35_37745 [Vitiosangium sp. GDMCC 1.1324]
MTVKKDLKKRIRERQEKTGESYTTARMHVLNQGPSETPEVRPVVLREVTPLAEAMGLKGKAFLSSHFPGQLTRPALERLREVLLATQGEPATRRMRAVLLRGEPDTLELVSLALELWGETRVFTRDLRLGMRGPSRSGRTLSFELQADGKHVTVVATLVPSLKGTPRLMLSTGEDYLRAEQVLDDPAALLESFALLDMRQ